MPKADSCRKHPAVSVRGMSRRRPVAAWVWQLAADRPGTMHEVILDELRSVILAGSARPGVPINVEDVARRFGASPIPVREALKTLIGESLVDHTPRSGYRVAQLTRTELAEIYVVREALETAALAAAVCAATAEDDVEVAAAHEALTRAIGEGDARGHHVYSRRLHLALSRPCRMRRLLGMFESAWNITEPLQPMSHVGDAMTHELHEDHRTMVEAFHARDAEVLLSASSLHYRRLQEVVETLPAIRLLP
jgi:DNA-binding GntR family transcriptional regulator